MRHEIKIYCVIRPSRCHDKIVAAFISPELAFEWKDMEIHRFQDYVVERKITLEGFDSIESIERPKPRQDASCATPESKETPP